MFCGMPSAAVVIYILLGCVVISIGVFVVIWFTRDMKAEANAPKTPKVGCDADASGGVCPKGRFCCPSTQQCYAPSFQGAIMFDPVSPTKTKTVVCRNQWPGKKSWTLRSTDVGDMRTTNPNWKLLPASKSADKILRVYQCDSDGDPSKCEFTKADGTRLRCPIGMRFQPNWKIAANGAYCR